MEGASSDAAGSTTATCNASAVSALGLHRLWPADTAGVTELSGCHVHDNGRLITGRRHQCHAECLGAGDVNLSRRSHDRQAAKRPNPEALPGNPLCGHRTASARVPARPGPSGAPARGQRARSQDQPGEDSPPGGRIPAAAPPKLPRSNLANLSSGLVRTLPGNCGVSGVSGAFPTAGLPMSIACDPWPIARYRATAHPAAAGLKEPGDTCRSAALPRRLSSTVAGQQVSAGAGG